MYQKIKIKKIYGFRIIVTGYLSKYTALLSIINIWILDKHGASVFLSSPNILIFTMKVGRWYTRMMFTYISAVAAATNHTMPRPTVYNVYIIRGPQSV